MSRSRIFVVTLVSLALLSSILGVKVLTVTSNAVILEQNSQQNVNLLQGRGVYVYMFEWPDVTKPRDWNQVMNVLSEANLNMIFPLVKYWGLLHYRSKVGPTDPAYFVRIPEDVDPLKVLVEEAHQSGIEVHVWMDIFGDGYGSPSPTLQQHPDWAAVNANNKSVLEEPAKGNQYWLCPSQEGPRNYLKSIILELVQNYSIDGVNLDRIRYPDENYCFCDYCKSKFMSDKGITSVNWPQDVRGGGKYYNEWIEWRSEQVSSFVKEIYDATKAVNPEIVISASVYPQLGPGIYTFGQDWKTWAEGGYLDVACPMVYHRDWASGVSWVREMTNSIKQLLSGTNCSVYTSVGGGYAYTKQMPPGEWVEAIKMAEEGGANGIVLFAYVCVSAAGAWDAIGEHFGVVAQHFTASFDGSLYDVIALSNSTVSNFIFSSSLQQVGFTVSGPSWTLGFCNVTGPRELLSSDPQVFLDTQPISFTLLQNSTHYFFYFTYSHSLHHVTIIGSDKSPLFPQKTTLTIGLPSTASVTKPINISSVLKDELGNPLVDAGVSFYVNENGSWRKMLLAPTNSSGVASFSYTPTVTAVYEFKASYGGGGTYLMSDSQVGAVTVNLMATSLGLLVEPVEVMPGSSLNITATLLDEDGEPISGENIVFSIYVGGMWKEIGSAITGFDGTARIDYKANITLGTYQVKAFYKGSQIYNESSQASAFTVSRIDPIPYVVGGFTLIIVFAVIAAWMKKRSFRKANE